ncbi:glycoside hydrolase family 140 protein [Mucilaginibacter daejeonensis]|uniref:glycoside hydrolase family 140 protein n=1 Tax=Mucilaginibacter daejeonensis TaxID=398049 RepID=UPI001D17B2CD|nr:glycoside hydrolase family 140 protein [Mucilaginibacter daejeonensis]UEG52847.1 glycoside hydrolase family 140 protein [Mucilaginibacter daejeonensis]
MFKKIIYTLTLVAVIGLAFKAHNAGLPLLKVSDNHRYFSTPDGKPFFWLGDTGWLLFSKLDRAEAEKYLEIRRKQGFNVIQVMVIHDIKETNAYGDSALVNKNIAHPAVTPGANPDNEAEYDYWDHVDYIVDLAAQKGIYMAMVPVWGSVVKSKNHDVPAEKAKVYAEFLAKRYKDRSNVIWMNGGDIAGSDSTRVWNTIGETLRAGDPDKLITYHPRGRTQSSTWFHNENWLDFNCFQSGHRTYAQDTSKKDLKYGEDNWKYVNVDYAKTPIRPTFDAEPSYEKIPYGLHDVKLPRWKAADVRRYAYWSVFAGGCGYTYGNNDVMQMHKPTDKSSAYGSKEYWYQSVNDPGAKQMVYIKELMLSRPYYERVPDQSLIAGKQGTRYNYLLATRGKNYAFIYTYTGRNISVNTAKLPGIKIKASWFDPRTGKITAGITQAKARVLNFNPPGEPKKGNDWVLILDAV